MPGENDLRKIIEALERKGDFKISRSTPLAGGSINSVYALNTSTGERVLKLNQASKFPGMFEAEKTGLEALKEKSSFDIPEVYDLGAVDNIAYLLMEHKPEGTKTKSFWRQFSENLASLHRNTAPEFGFPSSNYIGSLPQYNKPTASASEFYITQRLEPQLRLAAENGYVFKFLNSILNNIAADIPAEAPALIHGDLWSGNYLINEKGLPCLIDPAVSFGPREMDLAMMKLFGGFPEELFSYYSELFPLAEGFQERIPIWQLYYLLVHLNLFGSGYFTQVNGILKNFT